MFYALDDNSDNAALYVVPEVFMASFITTQVGLIKDAAQYFALCKVTSSLAQVIYHILLLNVVLSQINKNQTKLFLLVSLLRSLLFPMLRVNF